MEFLRVKFQRSLMCSTQHPAQKIMTKNTLKWLNLVLKRHYSIKNRHSNLKVRLSTNLYLRSKLWFFCAKLTRVFLIKNIEAQYLFFNNQAWPVCNNVFKNVENQNIYFGVYAFHIRNTRRSGLISSIFKVL